MILHLLKQIWTQRRRNAWIFAELFIVFVLAWYIIDYGFMMVYNRLLPRGFDMENTYRVKHRDLTTDADKEAFRIFYDKVKRYPGVQNAFLTGKYSGTTPFCDSFSGYTVKTDTTGASEGFGAQSKPVGSENYFSIFKVKSVIHPDRLGYLNFSDKNSIVLSENLAKALFKDEPAYGKTVFLGTSPYVVSDVVANQKRYDYEQHNYSFFYPSDDSTVTEPEIAIRVGDNFSLQNFKNDITGSIISYKAVKNNMEAMDGTKNNIRMRSGVMIFFLLNIALGIIGTFWFRNQSRRSEIGLRMALGSSQNELRAQYIAEAVFLLLLAAIPAFCVNAFIIRADIIEVVGQQVANGEYITNNKWLRFLITNAITFILLTIIVALSAWIPAYRASRVHPVEALREE